MTLTPRVRAWRELGRSEQVNGRDIHVFTRPGAGPLLLFLHGFPSSSYDWRLLLEQLPGRAALAYDCLGFGLSEKPADHTYTLIEQAEIAEELVGRHAAGLIEGGAEAVYAIGHDMGTSVATELMARDLEGSLCMDLAGVLLFNGSMIQGAASPTLAQRLLRGRLGPLMARLSSERFFRQQFGSIFSPGHPLSDDEAADQWSLIEHEGGSRLGHRLISYMDERVRRAERWYGALSDWPPGPEGASAPGGSPALRLAWGMLDPVATTRVLDGVRELCPQAPLTRFEDLGHYPQIEDPARLAAVLSAALDA